MIKYCIGIIVIAVMTSATATQEEVAQFEVTPAQSHYKDFEFHVLYEEQKLMHDQWKSYEVIICIVPGQHQAINKDGHVDIWNDKQFIYSSSVSPTTIDRIPITMRKKINATEPLLFWFFINPEFTSKSSFTYQVIRDDGSVEMNCVLKLNEFIKLPGQREKTDSK